MELKVKRVHQDAILPTYATDGSACMDLYAVQIDDVTVEDTSVLRRHGAIKGMRMVDEGRHVTFRTGLAFEVPPGHVLLIFSRSGHGFNYGVRLSNCVGVIDSDYRGEVKVQLTQDNGGSPLRVWNGDRIAQAMLVPIPRVQLLEVAELSETKRGEGGFGSTGA